MKRIGDFTAARIGKVLLTVLFTLISIAYIFPILMVVLNSFKANTFVKTEPLPG